MEVRSSTSRFCSFDRNWQRSINRPRHPAPGEVRPRSAGLEKNTSRNWKASPAVGRITPFALPCSENSTSEKMNMLMSSNPVKSRRYLNRVKVKGCVPSAS